MGPPQAEDAVERLLDRLRLTVKAGSGRFLVYADPDTGAWSLAADGFWAVSLAITRS